MYGIIRLINFAHGDFIMVGSYVLMLTIPAIVAFGLPAWVAVIPAILMCVAVGVIVERAAYKPVREKGNSMTALITAIAMSLLLENGSQPSSAPTTRPCPPSSRFRRWRSAS